MIGLRSEIVAKQSRFTPLLESTRVESRLLATFIAFRGLKAGRSILDRLRQAWGEYQRDYAFFLAAAMVYYAFVSLVPLLVLRLSGLGLMLRYSEFARAAEQQVLSAVAHSSEAPEQIRGERMIVSAVPVCAKDELVLVSDFHDHTLGE